jgi:hypothetical protein
VSTFADLSRAHRSALLELRESLLQTENVQLINRKYSNATLRATWPASQPFTTPARGIGQRSVNDLDQGLISAW